MHILRIGAVLAVVAATPAFAQTPAPPPGASPPQASGVAAVIPPGRRAAGRVEQHIDELRRRFAITPAQQGQWDAFATVMRDNAGRIEAAYRERTGSGRPMSAVDDLRSYAAIERTRADDVARLVVPFEALYGSMDEKQRAVADKTFQEFQRGPRNRRG